MRYWAGINLIYALDSALIPEATRANQISGKYALVNFANPTNQTLDYKRRKNAASRPPLYLISGKGNSI